MSREHVRELSKLKKGVVVEDKASVLSEVCTHLTKGSFNEAGLLLDTDYPFEPTTKVKRAYSRKQMVEVFIRDGFIDRYSGKRMVFPGALRVVSELLPEEFPWHPNGKMSAAHIAHWELFPTIDHVIPVSRGGLDEPSNWVCTSMIRNGVKSNWTLEELGWELLDGGSIANWDGLMGWFFEYSEAHPEILKNTYLKDWWRAASACAN